MKQLQVFLLVVLLPVLLQAQPKVNYKAIGAPIPPFKLQNEKGKILTNAHLKPGKPVLLMIFSPQCEHCEQMLDSLKNMAPAFANMQPILVTEARNKELFTDFRKGKGADIGKLFPFSGWDAGNLIYYIYTFQLLPQVNIYNSKHRLVHSFAGNFPLDSLKMFLK